MGAHNGAGRRGYLLRGQTVLLAAAFLLPGIAPSIFGWLNGLLAIPVFLLLYLYGINQGSLYIRNGALLAVAGAIPMHILPLVLFSLTFIPLGYSLNKSAVAGENEWRTGARGSLILGGSWLIFWAVYGALEGMNPYTGLLQMLDAGFAQAKEYYRTSGELPAEALLQLEQVIDGARALVPKILPGLLCCTVILTVWLNLIGSSKIVDRIRPGQAPWRKYSLWRLPDHLVWFAIASGTLLLLDLGILSTIALGVVLVCGLLYFFQGLAVFLHLLERWKVPLYFRIIIYAVLILQSYGLLLLTILGLADVWVDFRRRPHDENKTTTDESEHRED
ncbi:MAG: DUF2232 domain-containing protein [Desulfobulbaceae bacterium]|jgi:hypothetical protein|nr:DUF2232 domain-containing protein [Desulfobulbaceae bacterium]MDY0350939.1 DUF2232 domain-containing protein [Desulfobulbaceae bacterium]